jgi:hypothetical protein
MFNNASKIEFKGKFANISWAFTFTFTKAVGET